MVSKNSMLPTVLVYLSAQPLCFSRYFPYQRIELKPSQIIKHYASMCKNKMTLGLSGFSIQRFKLKLLKIFKNRVLKTLKYQTLFIIMILKPPIIVCIFLY